MAQILDGKQVVLSINADAKLRAKSLSDRGITPTLAIIRVGDRGDDIAYERSAIHRCEAIGVAVKTFLLPCDCAQMTLLNTIEQINQDDAVHGCLLLRPLPRHMNDETVRSALAPAKDIDGITDGSLAGVFAGTPHGFPPCTARACIEILDYNGYQLKGKRAVVIGRSLVIGKPVAMMLLQRHATVTICHTRTVGMPSVCREADVLIVAAGRAGVVGADYTRAGQIVIDVGINLTAEGALCGDVDFAAVEPIAGAITPVPGGVGTVTTSVLVKQVIEAAERTLL
ncbi:MAG: bifunctional 5,10-methylenetetrahydrofolate dehydrogenase/5,10-methenyltetrahydrofolate cyclohydrolase [Oscillospiraceae bacterium]